MSDITYLVIDGASCEVLERVRLGRVIIRYEGELVFADLDHGRGRWVLSTSEESAADRAVLQAFIEAREGFDKTTVTVEEG